MTQDGQDEGQDFDRGLALDALARVLASGVITQPSREADILRYVVNETLEGRGHKLKAFAIAVDVLGRSADFDPSTDSIVRVEVNRLRRSLALYKGGARPGETVIEIPKGQYRPMLHQIGPDARTLRRQARRRLAIVAGALVGAAVVATAALLLVRQPEGGAAVAEGPTPPTATAERPARPRLFLVPAPAGGDAARVRATMLNVMSRFEFVALFDRGFADPADHAPGGGAWPEDYQLSIAVRGEDDARIAALEVVRMAGGEVVAAETVPIAAAGAGPTPVEHAAARLVRLDGLILGDYAAHGDLSDGIRCSLLAYAYFDDQTDEGHRAARDCASAAIAAGDSSPLLYHVIAMMDREEYTDQRNLQPGNPLDRALAAAVEGTRLAPSYARGYYLQSGIYSLLGDEGAMLRLGRQAVNLNPYDFDIVGGFASRLNYAGLHREALDLLVRSEALSPVAGPWRDYAFFLAYLGLGDMQEAARRTAPLAGLQNPLYIAARAIAAGIAGDRDAAAALLAELEAAEPGTAQDPAAMFQRRNYHPDLTARLVEGLRAAGI
ncbi:MAG: hypothetical protein R3F55_25875 [Alphaproteobacteria bacterium]